MTSDLDLLGQFAREKSQDAFTALVNRHVNLVYSAALRQVRSPQLAEEIAQSVFADLARVAAAPSLPQTLTPWLYTVTRRTAIDVIRTESRRQLREQIAMEMNDMNATSADWAQIEPLLDDAMATLDETDRTAILLRFFENKNLHEVGEALGTSDDAAQKRVSRAVERLREFFSKRNLTIGTSGLAILISANAVQAAPIGLTLTIANTSLAAGTTLTFMKIATATKLKLAFNAIVVAGAVTAFIIQQENQNKLRGEDELLRQQIAQLHADNSNLSDRIAEIGEAKKLSGSQFHELLKLRGEVGVLRRQLGELAEKNHVLQAANASILDSKTNTPTPQVHIKSRFIAIPTGVAHPFNMNLISMKTSGSGNFYGIVSQENFSNVWQELSSLDGVETLAEPEVVTTSGQQTQMRATQSFEIVTNFTLQESNGVSSIVPQTKTVETGPVFDVTPRVLPDGYTIELPAIASVVDFLGYQPSANTAPANAADEQEIDGFKTSVLSGVTPAYTIDGQEIDVPTVSPQFRVQQATNSVSLLDNQTLVLMLNNDPIPAGVTFLEPDGSKSKYQNKKAVVLITATLVDAAGNRIRTDAENFTNTPASTSGQ